MDHLFEYQIRTSITKLKENTFQDFINELLIKKYGQDFTPLKQKRDQGCDGIIEKRKIVSAYAPPSPTIKEFRRKVEDDHEKYLRNWCKDYPEWCFIYNGEYTAEMLKSFDALEGKVEKLDINHVMDIIRHFSWAKKREIAKYLGLDEIYFINDVLKNVIEDLLLREGQGGRPIEHKRPIYIEDKIQVNFDEKDIQGVLSEYEDALPFLAELKVILKTYSDEELASLKSKVVTEFGMLSGNFKRRLNNLTEHLAERNKNDDIYKYYVRVVLIYLFEICLIGKKAKGE